MKLYKNIDGLAAVDKEGIIRYYFNYRPNINPLSAEDALNKHVLDVFQVSTRRAALYSLYCVRASQSSIIFRSTITA